MLLMREDQVHFSARCCSRVLYHLCSVGCGCNEICSGGGGGGTTFLRGIDGLKYCSHQASYSV